MRKIDALLTLNALKTRVFAETGMRHNRLASFFRILFSFFPHVYPKKPQPNRQLRMLQQPEKMHKKRNKCIKNACRFWQ